MTHEMFRAAVGKDDYRGEIRVDVIGTSENKDIADKILLVITAGPTHVQFELTDGQLSALVDAAKRADIERQNVTYRAIQAEKAAA